MSAGRSLEVSGGESVSVASDAVSVAASSSLEASAARASVTVSEDMAVVSGGAVTVASWVGEPVEQRRGVGGVGVVGVGVERDGVVGGV